MKLSPILPEYFIFSWFLILFKFVGPLKFDFREFYEEILSISASQTFKIQKSFFRNTLLLNKKSFGLSLLKRKFRSIRRNFNQIYFIIYNYRSNLTIFDLNLLNHWFESKRKQHLRFFPLYIGTFFIGTIRKSLNLMMISIF